MQLSREDILHIAELSRLELSESEVKQYQAELGSILDYVNMLSEVDTKQVEPTAQVSGLMDVFRDDEVKTWSEEEVGLALSQGERESGSLKVKRVL